MTLTLTDLFAGAGGSSTGAINVPGVEVKLAANHWDKAVEVHNANHPDADHLCADISAYDPRRVPRTDLLWASPECTNHSQAKGKRRVDANQPDLFGDVLPDAAAERSRATMWDVPRFTEAHSYRAIIVENVVDVVKWTPFHAWLEAMHAYGYEHQVVSLNSMHAQARGLPAPQSRDRVYIVLWRKGDRRPELEQSIRPRAFCQWCEKVVESRQAWKLGRTVGRYRQQYVYVCCECSKQVEPGWLPAAAAIDWSLPGQRIGDRARPLAEKTRARIAAGIARYWRPFTLEAAGNTFERRPGVRTWPIDDPLTTLHTSLSKALAVPVEGRDGKHAQTLLDVLRTQTTRLETALAWMPFIAELRGGSSDARTVAEALATVTAGGNHHGLVSPYYSAADIAKSTDDPIGTLTTLDRYGLITPAGGSWNDDARPSDEALRALTTRDAYGLLQPGFILDRRGEYRTRALGDPLSTITAIETTKALVMRNNTARGDQGQMSTPVMEALRTLTTAGHQSLIQPGDQEAAEAMVDDCLFRMLEPHEVAAGMAFPGDYIWGGNRRERVRMAGNAVTPPAARDLVAAVVEALA
jgi:DNA (cytosine-5)-methyltransferase 1